LNGAFENFSIMLKYSFALFQNENYAEYNRVCNQMILEIIQILIWKIFQYNFGHCLFLSSEKYLYFLNSSRKI